MNNVAFGVPWGQKSIDYAFNSINFSRSQINSKRGCSGCFSWIFFGIFVFCMKSFVKMSTYFNMFKIRAKSALFTIIPLLKIVATKELWNSDLKTPVSYTRLKKFSIKSFKSFSYDWLAGFIPNCRSKVQTLKSHQTKAFVVRLSDIPWHLSAFWLLFPIAQQKTKRNTHRAMIFYCDANGESAVKSSDGSFE